MSRARTNSEEGAKPTRQLVQALGSERVVLVEPRALIRDSLEALMSLLMRDVTIEAYAEPGAITAGRTKLALIGLDASLLDQGGKLERWMDETHEACGDAPIGVIALEPAPMLTSKLARLGVVGIVQPDNGIELALATIRMMMVGGFCMPPNAWAGDDGMAQASAQVEQLARRADVSLTSERVTCESNGTSRECSLTSRECDVLRILRAGRQNKLIAHELGISESTVKVHLRNIMKKLHATNRTQVALGTLEV